jgi:hypothetical protein
LTASADGKTDYLISAIRGVMVDSTTAFLSEQLDGRPVWIVRIPDVTFQGGGSVNPPWKATRDFDVYVDSATGLPIQAVARAHDYDASNWSKPPADSAARFLQMVGHEYHGTPTEAPKVSLLTAMTVIVDPLTIAKEIVAKYVLSSSPSHDTGPVWDVYMWGIRFGTQPGPRYLTDFGRWTIDAVDGTPLSCNNMPHQIPREADRLGD